jgi:hypothetical protein
MKRPIRCLVPGLTALVLLVLAQSATAETGMCLVVCGMRQGSDDFYDGDIRRIDMLNGVVARTTGSIGFGCFPRFSPDGTRFASIKADTVTVSTINGGVLRRFKAGVVGHLSWTRTGIYVGAEGKFVKFDTLGVWLWDKPMDQCNWGFVSQNDSVGAGVMLCCYPVIYDMVAGTSLAVQDKGGCSACPSPSGRMVSNNLWLSGVEHQRFRVLNKAGQELWLFNLQDALGIGIDYFANILTWSGNGENWMVLPVGQAGSGSYHQLTQNTSPWVFNVLTHEKYQFANRTSDHWQPHDYYSGWCPDSSGPNLQLSATQLDFAADSGGPNPLAQTVTASTSTGSLQGLACSGAPAWLVASPATASGASVLVNNVASIAGLRPGAYRDTVTVSTSNAGSRTYVVTLTLRSGQTPGVLASVEATPRAVTVAAGSACAFLAAPLDQFGRPITGVALSWSASGGGSVDASGLFTAGVTMGGRHDVVVTAQRLGVTVRDTANVVISNRNSLWRRVNCGDNAYDVAGWDRDDALVSGGVDYVNSATVVTAGIPAAAPATVYKSTRRQSPHSYALTGLPSGAYTVRLHLVEPSTGQARLMSYTIQNENVLRDFDVAARAGGVNRALALDVMTSVGTSGGLAMACAAAASGDVFEAGFEVIQNLLTPITLVSPAGGERYTPGQSVRIRWSDDSVQVGMVMIYVSIDDGENWVPVTANYGLSRGADRAVWGNYPWTVPDSILVGGTRVSALSTQCRIMVSNYTAPGMSASSDSAFTISRGAGIATGAQARAPAPQVSWSRSAQGVSITTAFAGEYTVKVVAINGAVVRSRALRDRGSLAFAAGELPAGAYTVVMSGRGQRVARRISVSY